MSIDDRRKEWMLTPREAGGIFRVGPEAVAHGRGRGWLPAGRTPGGHRRYRAADVQELIEQGEQ